MQKWDYAQIWVQWNDDANKRDFFVRYMTGNGN